MPKSAGPRVACSVRDILVASKRPGRDIETVATLRRFFDAVLVHGDPTLIPFEATFAEAERIATSSAIPAMSLHATTRRVQGRRRGRSSPPAAARSARRSFPRRWRRGPLQHLPGTSGASWPAPTFPTRTSSRSRRMRASARSWSASVPISPAPPRLSLSISQAGYNTTMDILSSGARAIVVPYEAKGETEQRLRAEILARKGLLTLVPAAELSPARLVQAVRTAMDKPAVAAGVDVAGAAMTARIVGELAAHRAVRRCDGCGQASHPGHCKVNKSMAP